MEVILMRLMKWDPLRDIETLHDRMNRVFNSALMVRFPEEERELGAWTPAIDITENEDHYLVTADIPGVSKEDVKVDFHDGMLTVKGEKRSEEKEEKDNYLRVERSFGSFVRTFTLPETVEPDKIKATYKDGVLKLSIPKKADAKPKKIEIKVQ